MRFVAFEADKDGRVYGHTAGGEVLPTGLIVEALAGRSEIPRQEIIAYQRELTLIARAERRRRREPREEPPVPEAMLGPVNLIASMITKNELGRYLPLAIEHLLEFCDEVRVVDDYSTDGTLEYLESLDRVAVQRNRGLSFDEHEGNARNELFRWTLLGHPTHVLAIDADEFISDGQAMRAAVETASSAVYSLSMEEVWTAGDSLGIRSDGGWRPHAVPCLYRAPARADHRMWQISPRQLACGREPVAVSRLGGRALRTGVAILHFGWTREAERRRRFDRYMSIDGGRFHNNRHLQSIMWPPEQVRLQSKPWPESLEPLRERMLNVISAR